MYEVGRSPQGHPPVILELTKGTRHVCTNGLGWYAHCTAAEQAGTDLPS
jgi:hypothetical protein